MGDIAIAGAGGGSMCGIVGYVGEKLGLPIVIDCLTRLEYRGYDSAGVAYLDGDELQVKKQIGKLNNLSNFLKNKIIPSSCAIGHTRWATHGEPILENAHPQQDANKLIALVHNGIIENFNVHKQKLIKKGVKFVSQTDTEVIAQLLGQELLKYSKNADNYSQNELHSTMRSTLNLSKKQILRAIHNVTNLLEGAYAFAVVIKGQDDCIFFAKYKSPLILGKGNDENFLSSDATAILPYTNKIYSLSDGQIGYIDKKKIEVYDDNLKPVKIKFETLKIEPEQIMLGEYKHFMHKEIEQGVESVINTIDRLKGALQNLPTTIFNNDFNLHIVACGTALHAGRVGKYLIENQLRIPVSVEYASEFRYKNPILNNKSICLFISQSGETADTLGSLELAKLMGAITIAITNVPASRIEKLADYVIHTSAGPEIAVASTKAYLAQLGAIYTFVEYIAKIKNIQINFTTEKIKTEMIKYSKYSYVDKLNSLVQEIKNQESIYFVGRGLDYLLALESALKLKEISYIHCEAFPMGELKHGSLALIHRDSIVIALLTQRDLIEKTLNGIHELNSRGAKIILFSPFEELKDTVYKFVKTPLVDDLLSPFVVIKPLQILAYLTSLAKNLDPDKPRNLAKSVTVE